MKENPFDLFTEYYENWFVKNAIVFETELLALQQLVPVKGEGLEVGIGTGIFAEKLGINTGVDPSEKMLAYAKRRKLNVVKARAEDLPYANNRFDYVVFITSICFVEDVEKALKEAYRVLKEKGYIIIAFIDKGSRYGKILEKRKTKSRFYSIATFYSTDEIITKVKAANFEVMTIIQTLIQQNPLKVEMPADGYGEGSFVVIKAKRQCRNEQG